MIRPYILSLLLLCSSCASPLKVQSIRDAGIYLDGGSASLTARYTSGQDVTFELIRGLGSDFRLRSSEMPGDLSRDDLLHDAHYLALLEWAISNDCLSRINSNSIDPLSANGMNCYAAEAIIQAVSTEM